MCLGQIIWSQQDVSVPLVAVVLFVMINTVMLQLFMVFSYFSICNKRLFDLYPLKILLSVDQTYQVGFIVDYLISNSTFQPLVPGPLQVRGPFGTRPQKAG